MQHGDTHVPDEQLLSLADGELDARQSATIRAHLASCWTCRARSTQLDNAIARFVETNQAHLEARIPPGDGARARLLARLAEARRTETASGWGVWRNAMRRVRAHAAVVATAAALGLIGWVTLRPATVMPDVRASFNPDVDLTPGAAVFRSRELICADRPRVEPPTVSRDVALAVFRTYGISDPTPDAYELDYLVSPEIGGSTDVRNLWPQPYAGRWNAHLKDALEDHLYDLVCTGQVDLVTAQQDVATDWIAAYKKYFRTDQPIAAHRTFRKDVPWR